MSAVAPLSSIQYVYDFAALERLPEGPTSVKVAARRLLSGPSLTTGKSSTVGAVLSGSHIICTLGTQAQGSGAKAHTHPNEQFNYILQGTMTGEVEGDSVFAPPASILHTPGMAVHTGLACPGEDLVFLAIKDTRHGIVGPPVDGKYNGPNYLPGYGTRAHESRQSTAEMMTEARRHPGPGKRYVYDMSDEDDAHTGPASVTVTPGANLDFPEGIRGKLLSGELLHVGVLRFAPGATIAEHAHDNEQFAFVVEGGLEAQLGGQAQHVGKRCLLHVPPGMPHAISAPRGALVVIAQDKHCAYSA
jgi:quercetin dioxygenase-like cupin family protein